MATSLVRTRIRDSRAIAVLALVALLLSRPAWPEAQPLREVADYFGYGLVVVCVLGRVWCSVFVGGWKNERLLTYGPYSIVRNPLYVFSFLGLLGVGVMTGSVVLTLLLAAAFGFYYRRVVHREEAFLAERFGSTYQRYCARVHRWIPRFDVYDSPECIELKPRFVLYAMRDGIWFFVMFPLIEGIEYMHGAGWLPNLFTLP